MKFPGPALALAALLALSGCCRFDQTRINDISVGMSKEQVQARLCQPERTSSAGDAGGNVEVLRYTAGTGERYFVRLKNGAVEEFGRDGELLRPQRPQGQGGASVRVVIRD